MKKLLTILAAGTATMFAFGINPSTISVADFEGENFDAAVGSPFNAKQNDSYSGETGTRFWYTADTDASNVISNYPSSGAAVPIASRPDVVAADPNKNFLQIETTGKLWRSVVDNGGSDDFTTNVTDYGYSIAETPIYLDTLVKFTAADAAFGDDGLTDGDKIAISYVECDAENDTIFDGAGYTNFVVRAGYVTGETTVVPTNYFVRVPDDFDKEQWHRLTVRTIPNVGEGSVGFVVYLDETNLTYSTDVAAGVALYTDAINSDVQSKFYNSEKHALFPSAVRTGSAKTTISAAAFQGNGSLDDVVFTTTRPNFIQESSLVTVTWDTNAVMSVSLIGKTTVVPDNINEVGSCDIEPDNGSVGFTVTFKDGYVLGECSVTGGAGGWNGLNTFTNLASGVTCDIASMRPLYVVNDSVYYDKLTDAISAAQTAGTAQNPATLKLLADCSEMIKFNSGYVVIDLAGHNIQGKSNQSTSISVVQTANVIVTNSVPAEGSVKKSLKSGGTAMTLEDTSHTAVYCVKFDGTIRTANLDETDGGFSIFSGTFLDADAENNPDNFTYKSYVQNDATVTSLGNNYFQVGAAAPTTFALTLEGGENAEIVTDPATITGFTEATNVAITATATNGFTYAGVNLSGTDWEYDSTNDAIGMTTNISANTTVVVPDAVAKQSEGWPADTSTVSGQTAEEAFGITTGVLTNADAKALADWAKDPAKGNVAYADRGDILPDAFLLDCANTQQAIDEAAANFKITSITVVGDAVTIEPADGADYGNGKVVIESTATLSPISWREKTLGDHFFRATLVVKPVATP